VCGARWSGAQAHRDILGDGKIQMGRLVEVQWKRGRESEAQGLARGLVGCTSASPGKDEKLSILTPDAVLRRNGTRAKMSVRTE
jgi:hypothetical protein